MKVKNVKLDRLHVTLVELLVVIAIIGSIAGVVGLSIQKALHEQRFKNEVEEFVSTLRLAQNLMLITDADIHVKMLEAKSEIGIAYGIESDRKLPDGWDRELKRPPKVFKAIHHVSNQTAEGGALDLKFFSGGVVMSKGTIALADNFKNPDLVRYINLPGYPSPIKASLNPTENQEEDDSQITTITIQEILTLQQTKESREENEKK